jgi:hypothetical protein
MPGPPASAPVAPSNVGAAAVTVPSLNQSLTDDGTVTDDRAVVPNREVVPDRAVTDDEPVTGTDSAQPAPAASPPAAIYVPVPYAVPIPFVPGPGTVTTPTGSASPVVGPAANGLPGLPAVPLLVQPPLR